MPTFTRAADPIESDIREAAQALRSGDFARAAAAARRAASLAPQRPETWWLWGLATMDQWAYAEADDILSRGLSHIPAGHPLRARFLTQRVRALVPQGRNSEACDMARQALAAGADGPDSLAILGMALGRAGREAEALPLLRRAVALAPDSAAFRHGLGDLQQFVGRNSDAEASYEAAVRLAPNSESYLALARLRRWTREHNHINALQALKVARPLDEARRAYALFKELSDIGEDEQAWTWLETGAQAARRQPVTVHSLNWSRAAEADTVGAWKRALPESRFAAPAPPPLPSRAAAPRRIFIIGLPRSGTTLTERVLTAHSQVQALGELQTFGVAVKRLSGSTTPPVLDVDTIERAAKLDPRRLAEVYDRETAYLSDGSAYTIDKLPHNHDYAGLIRLAWPDAIIVHVQRAPMDSLFGALKLHVNDNYRWSFDQDDLADHYALYRELMQHWRDVLGDGLIEVSLEALIADPEGQIRRLLDTCGLPFEPACLNPHETAGAVASASSSQVRKPINAEGVGAWRRYAGHLEPLRRRLFDMGYVDAAGNAI